MLSGCLPKEIIFEKKRPMNLDPKTIVVINSLGSLIMSIGMFAVSRSYLKEIGGIQRWAFASFLHSFGWIFLGLRGIVPDYVTLLLASTCLLSSLGIFHDVIARFVKHKIRYKWKTIWICTVMVVLVYYNYVQPDISIRTATVSLGASVLLAASAQLLLFRQRKQPLSYFITGFIFLIPAVVFGVRAVYFYFFNTNPVQHVFDQNIMQTIVFLTTFIASVMLTFGFLLMSSDTYFYERKKVEQKLLRNEENLNQAQKLAKIGSWEFNLETNELTWSKEMYEIFELPSMPENKLFDACREKIVPEDLPLMDKALQKSRETGEGTVYEHRILSSDGSLRYLLGIGETLKGEDKRVIILRGSVQDITEQKQNEETARKYAILESKSKEMEQFAYIASHDLREPLLTIKNYTELFNEEYGNKLPDEPREYLSRIIRASNRMDQLIKGLLDYSRLSRMKELQRVDCAEIIQQVLADLDAQIKASNAKILVYSLPILKAYPLEMKQLFQNLLSNAIKFRKKDMPLEISISATKPKGVWTFEIKDNGIGIAEEDYEKVFGLFQRLNNKNEYPGSGIGLAYCKKIVELHHGTIWVHSQPGAGSTFYFTILT